MKKLLFLLCAILFVGTAQAETIQVEALDNFSTAKPISTMKVKVLTDITLDESVVLKIGDIAEGKIIDVESPKRLKRNAKFSFKLTSYYSGGSTHYVNKEYIGHYTTQFDKIGMAKTAALTAGNYFVHGISAGYTAIEGAVKNEEDNRLKSSAVALYESSPISYVEKGEDIVIKKNDKFLLRFKVGTEENELEYSEE